MSVQIIPISSIIIGDNRQRQLFPEQEMAELSNSIEEKGLFSPILVRPHGEGKYLLVAGERRLRVTSKYTEPYTFGETVVEPGSIPAVVKFFKTDMDAEEAELHENVVRLGLTWQEKAAAITRLHEFHVNRNPKHRIGETAILVEDEDGVERDYAKSKTYEDIRAALFVTQHMEDPEVQKAKTLRDAAKIASRKFERDQLAMLAKLELPTTPPTNQTEPTSSSILTLGSSIPELPTLPTVSHYKKTFYEGDMQEELLNIKDKSVHLVLTDPPYGMGVDKFDDGGNATLKHEYSENDFMELHVKLFEEMQRICTDGAHAYIFCHLDYFHEWRNLLIAQDWWVRPRPLVWSKGAGKMADGTPQGFSSSYELILFARRGSRPCRGVMPDVLRIPNERARVHAAQKPRMLYDTLINHSTIPGDTVLDAFAGSGTIFRTKEQVNVIGIEKSPAFALYCRKSLEGGVVEGDVGEEE